MKNLVILGSTGSIGTQALNVVRQHPEKFKIKALAAGNNVELLIKQALEFRPYYICIKDKERESYLKSVLSGSGIHIVSGDSGLCLISTLPDAQMVLVAIVGVRALLPTINAIESGKDIALASKEILVAAGHIVMDLARKKGVSILPVDSEHGAILQCMQGNEAKNVEKITLTASGGPFFGLNQEQLSGKTLKDALAHPNWDMGRKITIDSASLINKGLEVIEAHWLFNLDYKNIDVVIHRESIIHSMVTYCDGSMIAQMGAPDMCIPIQYALSFPERLASPWPRINLARLGNLSFYEPDHNAFPSLKMAYSAGIKGGSAPVVLNAANEEAVNLFLEEKIKFVDIPGIIANQLDIHDYIQQPSLDDLIEIDKLTRLRVQSKYGH